MNFWLALVLCVVIGFIVAYLLGFAVVPWLRKLKFGQEILDIGPSWHKKKQGTPTMGGILIIAGFIAAVSVVLITDKLLGGNLLLEGNSRPENVVYIKIFSGILMAAAFSFIGFIDDYIKLFKKRNKGLSASGKLFIQVLAAAAYMVALHFCGYGTQLNIPFIGNVDFGIFYYPIVLLGIMYFVNCVNLTDGIDGLAGSVTLIVTVFFSAVAIFKVQSTEALVLTLPMLGALIGFLFYNLHPAKIFMGDTGSLMLGGFLVAAAFLLKMPIFLLICGFVYIFEGISVMLQVISFKLTGKRIFKMSPLHHHFEMCGWSEGKIVGIFSLATAVLCVISYFAIV